MDALNCYCLSPEFDSDMISCSTCKKHFHPSCMKSGRPSTLTGDIYFSFTCQNCSRDGTEIVKRKKLKWHLVIRLALYNLQLQSSGKCGYYRFQEHICQFIDKNWAVFFGDDRDKSNAWQGTVSGCLSNYTNRFFVSGMEVLGKAGWWSLKSSQLPSLDELDNDKNNMKPFRKCQVSEIEASPVVDGSRKKRQKIVKAAVALKERKTSICCDAKSPKLKKTRQYKTKSANVSDCAFKQKLKLVVSHVDVNTSSYLQDSSKCVMKSEADSMPTFPDDDLSKWIKEPKINLGLNLKEVASNTFDLSNSLDGPKSLNSLFDEVLPEIGFDTVSIKEEYERKTENSNLSNTVETAKKPHFDTNQKRKAVTKKASPVKEIVAKPKFTLMCLYEEDKLLQKLQKYPTAMIERPEVRKLYRKLVVRKIKREKKLPVFDIDAEMWNLRDLDPPDYVEVDNPIRPAFSFPKLETILDRYQMKQHNNHRKSLQNVSFFTRLMGLENEDQTSIISPYTERILKPFIFRDFKTKPMKMRLLEEIVWRTNRDNPEFITPKQVSIDYCYVRPQHIPGVNALCEEFFWPGIDMSESLQYPDFSCVALYKKVIGFAFMVPDVKYNEAYISFIFCHPEWRTSGVATFMLYHLIQTCMGKDVTLHVSATSSAVFLYQKFGFKVEEFIHDFYDKYLPPDSKECRHALFLRLSQ